MARQWRIEENNDTNTSMDNSWIDTQYAWIVSIVIYQVLYITTKQYWKWCMANIGKL